MKKVLLIAPLAFLAACSQPAVEGDFQTLTWKRDSTKNVVDALNEQIALYDAAIAAMDTTVSYDAVTAYEFSRINSFTFLMYSEPLRQIKASIYSHSTAERSSAFM